MSMKSQPYPRSPKALLGGIAHLGRSRKTLVGHAQWEPPIAYPQGGRWKSGARSVPAVKDRFGHTSKDWKYFAPSQSSLCAPIHLLQPETVPDTKLGKLCVPARRNRLRVNREIGRANGSGFLWAVIDETGAWSPERSRYTRGSTLRSGGASPPVCRL